jgi:hypothetical protein
MNNLPKTTLYQKAIAGTHRRAVALVLTLVVLAVLTTIVYGLSSRIAQVKHRRQYLIDYQISRYACDSAMKYALAAIKRMDFKLIDRRDKPDFSDVFTMDRIEYEQYLDEWAQKLAEQKVLEGTDEDTVGSTGAGLAANQGAGTDMTKESIEALVGQLKKFLDDPNTVIDIDPNFPIADYTEPNEIFIPGPYGPEWPHVRDPIRFDIGQTNIVIEFTDENAKMPLTWAVADDAGVRNFAIDALEAFGEWMQMDPIETLQLLEQLEDVEDIKRFTINPKPINITQKAKKQSRKATSRTRSRSRKSAAKAKKTQKKTLPVIVHTTDFAKLLHGSAIDLQSLAKPLLDTGNRNESPLKYMALWGSQRVNINTAPRHVLEAAFTFGGDAEDNSESIKKTKNYITTASTFFAIKVTARQGRAKTTTVATVVKQGRKIQPIAVISHL